MLVLLISNCVSLGAPAKLSAFISHIHKMGTNAESCSWTNMTGKRKPHEVSGTTPGPEEALHGHVSSLVAPSRAVTPGESESSTEPAVGPPVSKCAPEGTESR